MFSVSGCRLWSSRVCFLSPSILSQRMWKPSSLQISKMMPFLGLLSRPVSLLFPSWSGDEATGRDTAPSAAEALSFPKTFPGKTQPSDVFFLPKTLEKMWGSVRTLLNDYFENGWLILKLHTPWWSPYLQVCRCPWVQGRAALWYCLQKIQNGSKWKHLFIST